MRYKLNALLKYKKPLQGVHIRYLQSDSLRFFPLCNGEELGLLLVPVEEVRRSKSCQCLECLQFLAEIYLGIKGLLVVL